MHGSARSPLHEYVFPEDIYNAKKIERIFSVIQRYCFQGHTHAPGVFTEDFRFPRPDQIDDEYALDFLQAILLDIYRKEKSEAMVCERLLDLDEGLQEWRYRHVKMVERTMGHKIGTGGSEGAEFLRRTLFHPVFPDLWEIRSRF